MACDKYTSPAFASRESVGEEGDRRGFSAPPFSNLGAALVEASSHLLQCVVDPIIAQGLQRVNHPAG